MSSASPSPLRQLADIISKSVDIVDAEMAKDKLKYPHLEKPFDPLSPEEVKSMSPEIRQAAALIVSACSQLSANVHVPAMTLYDAIGGFHVSSAMRAALEGNVVELLRDKPEGLDVNDIAAKNGADPSRLARVLRLLATHYIFTEVAPDVFANNRLSSLMDTTKTLEEIKADPINKHTSTPGVAAVLEHSADELMKASAYLTEILYDPVKKSSTAPEDTPLALAFKTNKYSYDWYTEPGNAYRLKRFAAAMEGSARVDPPNAILSGFSWESLSAKSVVVDVKGGLGHLTQKIVQQRGDLRFIVQDAPKVIAEAEIFWQQNMHPALADGTVTLQAHDFFTPQPKANSNVAVFLARMLLHDYPEDMATVILKHLRDAAGTETKLLLVEQVIPYVSSGPPSAFGKKLHTEFPKPLLSNGGKAKAIAYLGDFQMFVGSCGEERTLGSWEKLLQNSGWKIKDVFVIPGSMHSQILAIPV